MTLSQVFLYFLKEEVTLKARKDFLDSIKSHFVWQQKMLNMNLPFRKDRFIEDLLYNDNVIFHTPLPRTMNTVVYNLMYFILNHNVYYDKYIVKKLNYNTEYYNCLWRNFLNGKFDNRYKKIKKREFMTQEHFFNHKCFERIR